MRSFSIQKPLQSLPKLLVPTPDYPLFPPRFHWGIPVPFQAMSDYVKHIREQCTPDPDVYEKLMQDYPETELEPPPLSDGPPLLVPDDCPDIDKKPLLTPNRNSEWDLELILCVIRYIEEKLGIPSQSVRCITSTYRNLIVILSFYSSYEMVDSRMTDAEIDAFLIELGIPNVEKYWWCADYRWSFKPYSP
jgi:hypothetical protein